VSGGITRSWIESYDVEHLHAASTYWTQSGELLEYQAEGMHSEALHPGGTLWEGTGADAAADRTWGDVVTARGGGDAMRNAAGFARNGADDLTWAKRQAQQAITDAEAAGFTVSEDLSVTDSSAGPLTRTTYARQQQAQEFAADIAARAQTLAAMDQTVADQITAAAIPLQALSFGNPAMTPTAPSTSGHHDGATAQMVDYDTSKEHQNTPDTGAPANQPPSLQDLLLPTGPADPTPTTGAKPAAALDQPHSLEQMLLPAGPADPNAAAAPPRFDPNTPQGKAALAAARQVMINDNVPPAQIEQRLAAMAANAQKPLPAPSAAAGSDGPAPPKPSYSDGFRDAWDQTGDAVHRLTGQDGLDNFKSAWQGVGKNLLDTAQDPIGTAVHGVQDQIKAATDNPEYWAGQRGFDAAAGAATLPLGGGEGALARGTLGNLAEHDAANGLIDSAAPTHHLPPIDHPTPHVETPTVEHHELPPGHDHPTTHTDHDGHSPGNDGDLGEHPGLDHQHPPYSSLPTYAQQSLDRAVDNPALQRDLIDHGVPADIAHSASHDPYAGMTPQDVINNHYTPDGRPDWPLHDGFLNGQWKALDHIPENVQLDRIGEVSGIRGDFMGSAGDSYPSRALAPGSSGDYHVFQGTGKQLPSRWELHYGEVAPEFGQPGGGTQWIVVDKKTGAHILIKQLLEDGYLR